MEKQTKKIIKSIFTSTELKFDILLCRTEFCRSTSTMLITVLLMTHTIFLQLSVLCCSLTKITLKKKKPFRYWFPFLSPLVYWKTLKQCKIWNHWLNPDKDRDASHCTEASEFFPHSLWQWGVQSNYSFVSCVSLLSANTVNWNYKLFTYCLFWIHRAKINCV